MSTVASQPAGSSKTDAACNPVDINYTHRHGTERFTLVGELAETVRKAQSYNQKDAANQAKYQRRLMRDRARGEITKDGTPNDDEDRSHLQGSENRKLSIAPQEWTPEEVCRALGDIRRSKRVQGNATRSITPDPKQDQLDSPHSVVTCLVGFGHPWGAEEVKYQKGSHGKPCWHCTTKCGDGRVSRLRHKGWYCFACDRCGNEQWLQRKIRRQEEAEEQAKELEKKKQPVPQKIIPIWYDDWAHEDPGLSTRSSVNSSGLKLAGGTGPIDLALAQSEMQQRQQDNALLTRKQRRASRTVGKDRFGVKAMGQQPKPERDCS